MKTKHLIAGAAGLSFAGLLAYTTLSDPEPDIPENLTGSILLRCTGTIAPVHIVDGQISFRQEESIDAAAIDLHLHFNAGQVTSWNVSPPPEQEGNRSPSRQDSPPLSNIEIAAHIACPDSPNHCTPQQLGEKSIRLFEYSYIIQQQAARLADSRNENENEDVAPPVDEKVDEKPAPPPATIKGYGLISKDFRYFAGLQDLNGEITTTSLGCQITDIKQTYDIR